jgi:hypothetical protein
VVQRSQPDLLSLKEAADLGAPDNLTVRALLCYALADRIIGVEALIAQRLDFGVYDPISNSTSIGLGNISIPLGLRHESLDWEDSRPLAPWSVGPAQNQPDMSMDSWEPRPIVQLRLRRADVEAVLGVAAQPAIEPTPVGQPDQPSGPGAGRPPEETNRVRDRMLADLRSGAISIEDLRTVKADSLAHDYGTTRYIIRKARNLALQLFEK